MLKNLRTRGSVFGPLISVLAVILGLVLVGPISPANAGDNNGNNDECVPSGPVPASFSPWAIDHYTAWSSSDTAPADPDGDGANDPANLTKVGDREQTPVSNHDGGTTTVTDVEAWVETVPAVPAIWANFSPNNTQGPFTGPPTWDSDARGTWHVHYEIPEGHADEPDGVYDRANEHSGNADWFYKQSPVAEHTIQHAAQTHEVVRDDTMHTEYRWAIQTRTYKPAKDAVTCDKGGDPKGSNGHVKVDDDSLDGDTNNGHGNGGNDNGNGNDPHLNCTFNIEWYGYDTSKEIYSTVNFISQAPTADADITVVSGDTHPKLDSNGGWVETYTLNFSGEGDPQHNHGYHVMITIDTEGTIGADQKHKTFWVEGDCTPTSEQPNPVTVTEPVEGCDLNAYGLEPGTGHRDGQREYVLVGDEWQLEDMADVAWGSWVQDTTLTDDEYQVECAEVQPAALTRSVPRSESGCAIGGVHTWNDVYTTPYVWDAEKQAWVLGTETGPVAEDDVVTLYTAQELEDLHCVEVEGEQGHGHHHNPGHHNTPEVKGEQAHAPAAAVVPTEVEAGLAGTPAEIPTGGGSNNLPLWALSLGAGMFLIGAGRLRRTSRATR